MTVDASLKDYSLPVIDRAPESLSELPSEVNEDDIPAEEENDALGAIKNFPQTARTAQHLSPSSGSDVDVSVVESESDTLAAVTPNNPTSEVDVDLIKQFERLVLNKQGTPTLNTTFPLEEKTPVNETACSVIDYEDLIPADATRDVLSDTRDLSTVNNNNPEDESELATPFHDLDQSSFVDAKSVTESINPSVLEESALAKSLKEDEEEPEPLVSGENSAPEQEEPPAAAEEEKATVAVAEEIEETPTEVQPTETAQNVESTVEEEIEETSAAQDVQEPETQVLEGPAAHELQEPTTAQESVVEPTVSLQDLENSIAKEETSQADEKLRQNSEEFSETAEEKVTDSESSALAAEPNASIEDEEERAIPASEATTPSDQSIPVAEELSTLQVEPAEFVSNEVDVPTEDESTVLSVAEQTVLNAADKSASVEVNESAVHPASADESVESTQITGQKPTSLPEEKPIVPKKGYDLSFLDRFDDLENATPSISQAKLLFSLTPSSESAALNGKTLIPSTSTTLPWERVP